MDEWRKYRLGDLFERVTRKNINLESKNVLTISAQYGLINQEEFFNKSVAGKNLNNYYLIKKGEFAYNKSYSAGYPMGATKILEKYDEGIVSTLYICFRSKSDLVNNEYFKYYFESKQYYDELSKIAEEGARNHGLLNISVEDFFNIQVILPPIKEQEKIVRILDNVDKIIKKIEKLKNNIKLSKKYIMNINFRKITNKGKRMKEVCTFFSGGTPSSQNKKYYEGDIPFIRSAEIDNCSTELKINDDGIKNSSAKIVKKGDLLLALYGANSGNVAISKIEGAINQAILCIRSNEIKIKYLKYLLEYDKNNILNKYLQGGQGNLSAEIIKNLKYNFQIKEEQEKIINILDLIENKINMIDILKEQYINVKKGLMQQLLTGKIRVKI